MIKKLPIILFLNLVLWVGIRAQETTLAERLESHISILASDSLEGRGLGTLGKEKAEKYIINAFEEAGLKPLKGLTFKHKFEFRSGLAWIPANNIVGVIPGSDPVLKNEYIVIGAHYDHLGFSLRDGEKVIFPGADDNASGVASIIEIAKKLVQRQSELKRSVIIIAFDAEESGLLGAERFLQDTLVPPDKIKFMFSLDMVGMYAKHGGLDLKGIEGLVNGASMAEQAAGRHGIKIKKMGSGVEARTDTKPFGDRGIPTAHVFTGLKSPYHKPEDKYDLLDYEGMALINLFMEDLALEMSKSPELQAAPSMEASKVEGKKKKSPLSAGILLNNGGGYHDYIDEFFYTKRAYNFSGGLYLNIPVNRLMAIQPEVLYDFNGSRSAEGTFRRQALTVPLNIQVGTPRFNDVRFYGFAGAYYRHIFNASNGGVSLSVGDSVASDEWGISFGFALELSKLTLGWTLRRGLTDVGIEGLTAIRDRSSMFTLGYRF